MHWSLLVAGVAGAVAFNATYLIDGALRRGYDQLGQPVSALSLGPGGAVQVSAHAQVHNAASYISLTVTVAGLLILARRFAREPEWHGWAPAALAAAVLMVVCLAVFGVLIAHGGPGGIFEKLASLTPTLFGVAGTTR